jgi:putative membrane-bound dehydrogenase-like protein
LILGVTAIAANQTTAIYHANAGETRRHLECLSVPGRLHSLAFGGRISRQTLLATLRERDLPPPKGHPTAMHRIFSAIITASFLIGIPTTLFAQAKRDVIPHAQDKAPGPALSPAEAIAKMTVPEGFTVELVASEPDIVNPVAMTIDERGRFWITESLEYPRKAPGPGKDRVKVLEDTDGDGKADKFTVFMDGLNIPSGIAVGHGGVWIANAPDILFVQDTDGDGKADKQEVVVTGFGRFDTHELPNSLTWGPDGWLYGLNGVFNPAHVTYPKDSPWLKHVGQAFQPDANAPNDANSKNKIKREAGQPGKADVRTEFNFTCAMFRIHPRTREFQVFCEGTSNPWGIAFDGEGSAFVSACVIDHLWHLVETGYYHRQGGPYPPFTWKIESIVKHKHQKAAYCGIHWFDSDAYPEKYREKLYMGNIHGGCINVDKLQRDGSTYSATPEPDFLTANDAWFMPVVQKTGPDGCLYILDWYDRYHCYQDANRDPAGIDRLKGRLYRVRYKDSPRTPKGFDLAKETDEQLIKRLGAKNDFIHATAQRLLVERNTETIGTLLLKNLRGAGHDKFPQGQRRRMFCTLGSMSVSQSERAWSWNPLDPDPVLRSWTSRFHGDHPTFADHPLNGPELVRFHIHVINPWGHITQPELLQAVIAVSKAIRHSYDKPTTGHDVETYFTELTKALAYSSNDPVIARVVWQNLHPFLETHADQFVMMVQFPETPKNTALMNMMPRVVERMLARQKFDGNPIAKLFAFPISAGDPQVGRDVLAVLAAKVQSGELKGDKLDQLKTAMAEPLKPLLVSPASHPLGLDAALLAVTWKDATALGYVRQTWTTAGLAPELRLQALRALVAAGDEQLLDVVSQVLMSKAEIPNPKPQTPNLKSQISDFKSQISDFKSQISDFKSQTLAALGQLDQPRVADVVLQAYPHLEPDVQPKAIELLTQRASWAKRLLPRLVPAPTNGGREPADPNTIPASALNLNQARRLLDTGDKELAGLVEKHWGSVRSAPNADRAKMIADMKQTLRTTPGDPFAGEKAFKKVCAQCHKIYGEGADVGPDVTSNGRNDFNQLLSNVFDPSLVIGAGYRSYTVATQDGRVLNGLLVEESPQRVVLKVQGGKLETIPRADIDVYKVSEISMMPEQLEKQLTPQEIIDLFAFLILDKHPSDKSAKRLPGVTP